MICIIPARKGSKRLPGKNYKELKGKPLIQHTLDQATAVFKKDDIYVVSDCPTCLKIAEENKVNPINLPGHKTKDDVTMAEMLEYVVKYRLDKKDTYICLLQPTSPLRRVEDIKNAIGKWYTGGKEPLYCVKPIVDNDIKPNGAGYIYSSTDVYKKFKCYYEMPAERSIDIDTALDFQIAEILYEPI